MKHVDRLGQEQHENHIGMWGVYVGKTTLLRFPSSEDNPGVDLFDDAYCRTRRQHRSCWPIAGRVFPKLTSLPGEGCWDGSTLALRGQGGTPLRGLF